MASTFSEIKPIATSSVHRICSGQVVLSLAIAVKELLENAIDADATAVDVKLKNYGLDSIAVTDNGCGIAETNYAKLTMKHYTSKIQDFDDLTSVATFGFRGEALSSLCALSRLSMMTSTEGAQSGTEITYDKNGRIVSQTPCAHERGTTLRLEALFAEWPVRLRELQKNIKREFGKLIHLLNAYCLVRPDVRISCVNITNKGTRSSVLQSPGKGSLASVIKLLFGMKQMRALVPVNFSRGDTAPVEIDPTTEESKAESSTRGSTKRTSPAVPVQGPVDISIDGYVSSVSGPNGGGRSSNDRQFLSINQRPCDMPKVARAISEVFHVYDRSKAPVYVLNITLPRAKVDINVTPDKRSIFTLQESQVIDTIKETLQNLWAPTQHQYDLVSTQPSLSHFLTTVSGSATSIGNSDDAASSADAPTVHPGGDTLDDAQTPSAGSKAKRKSPSSDNTSSPAASSDVGSPTTALAEARVAKRRRITFVCNVRGCVKYRIEMHSLAALESHYKAKHPRRTAAATVEETHHRRAVRRLSTSQRSVVQHVSDDDDAAADTTSDDGEDDTTQHTEPTCDGTAPTVVVDSDDDTAKPLADAPLRADTADPHVHTDATTFEAAGGDVVDGRPDDVDALQRQDAARLQAVAHAEASVLTEADIADVQATNAGKTRPACVRAPVSLDRIALAHRPTDARTTADAAGGRFLAVLGQSTDSEAEAELKRTISQPDFLRMEILGQFNLGFIVTRLGNDLFIVDQHASEEKYNFERLQATTQLQTQRLVVPRRLELTAVQESVLVDNLDIFRRNGFDFTMDDTAPATQRVRMTQIPYSRGTTFGASDVDELIFMLADDPHKMCRPSRVRAMFASRACRTSVMIGTALDVVRMRAIVDHMSTLGHPWNCPHGRPTMRHMFDLRRMPPH